jgi:hypothetical protein
MTCTTLRLDGSTKYFRSSEYTYRYVVIDGPQSAGTEPQLNVRREACAHGDALPYSNWRDSLLHDVFLSPSALFRREGNAGANRADLNTDARPRQ